MKKIENAIVTNVRNVVFLAYQRGVGATTEKRPCYGISFCVDGHITFEVDGETVELTKDCAVLLPEDGHYTWICRRAGSFPQINFDTAEPITDRIIKFELGSYPLFDPKLRELQNALITNSHAKSMSLFYDIIDSLGGKSNRGSRILTPAVDYMLSNFGDATLSNGILAEKAGISEVYFRQLFREAFGTTPKQYILELRLKKARKLLTESPSSISDIAETCGFSGVYHFCRAFKNAVGLPPSEYAKKNKNRRNM